MQVLVSSYKTSPLQGGVGSRCLCIAPTQRRIDSPRVFALAHRTLRPPTVRVRRRRRMPTVDARTCVYFASCLASHRSTVEGNEGELGSTWWGGEMRIFAGDSLGRWMAWPCPGTCDAPAAARAHLPLAAVGNWEARCTPRRSVRVHRPSQSRTGGVRSAGARKGEATVALDVRVTC